MNDQTPLPRSSERAADAIVREIEARIVSGALPDGAHLPPERDLIDTYGVSRTVVREAVAVLASRGLLDSRPRHRPVVRRPGAEAALAAALIEAVNDPLERHARGEAAYEQIRGTYSWDTIATRVISLYEGMLARRPPDKRARENAAMALLAWDEVTWPDFVAGLEGFRDHFPRAAQAPEEARSVATAKIAAQTGRRSPFTITCPSSAPGSG